MNPVVKHYIPGRLDFKIASREGDALVAKVGFVQRGYAALVYLAITLVVWCITWIVFNDPWWYQSNGLLVILIIPFSFIAHWLCTSRNREVRSIETLATLLKIPGEHPRGLLIGEFARRGWEAGLFKAEQRVYLAFVTSKLEVDIPVLLCFEGLDLTATNARLWLASNAIVAEEGPRLTLEDRFWGPILDSRSYTALLTSLNASTAQSQLAVG